MILEYCFEWINKQANIIGIIGVVLVLIAYLLLQLNQLAPKSITYSLLNTVGSAAILVSLYFYWNLASGVIEIAWLIISVYGLIQAIKRRTIVYS